MTVFYQRFIPNYVKLAEPLYQHERKRVIFAGISETLIAYEKVLTRDPVLSIPDDSKQFELYIDASVCVLSAMLHQKGKAIA